MWSIKHDRVSNYVDIFVNFDYSVTDRWYFWSSIVCFWCYCICCSRKFWNWVWIWGYLYCVVSVSSIRVVDQAATLFKLVRVVWQWVYCQRHSCSSGRDLDLISFGFNLCVSLRVFFIGLLVSQLSLLYGLTFCL